MDSFDKSLIEAFINYGKFNFSPDAIRTNTPKLSAIRNEYDKKLNESTREAFINYAKTSELSAIVDEYKKESEELVKWFWEEVDRQTTDEEKKIWYSEIDDYIKHLFIKGKT